MNSVEKVALPIECLDTVIAGTDFPSLGERYVGKVRDGYQSKDRRVLITTDRLSCFDVVLTTIPYKGQVINQLAQYWFEQTVDIIPNHVISVPDPNVMLVKNCAVIPIEVVVRGYLAGSAWKAYTAGKTVSGIKLPAGLQNYQKLPQPLLTPSTKAAQGDHDQPISVDELLDKGTVSRELWSEVSDAAFALFVRGQEIAARNGLILCDTKYEFGTLNGELVLVDELHTLDSSRYWIAESYQERVAAGGAPVMLDKQTVREWLLARGYDGNGTPPEFTPEHRLAIASEYIASYQMITGREFVGAKGEPLSRIRAALGIGPA